MARQTRSRREHKHLGQNDKVGKSTFLIFLGFYFSDSFIASEKYVKSSFRRSNRALSQSVNIAHGQIELAQHITAMIEENLAGSGETVAFAPAIQKARIQRILQRSKRMTDGRLREIETLRRQSKTSGIDNRHKCKHLADFRKIAVHS
jgi:hypothetical protein